MTDPSIIDPVLENIYLVAEEFYDRIKKIDTQVANLRAEQAQYQLLYDILVAQARDIELFNSEKL
jgi:hypothetical protein